ncbi:MAG: TonB-dependent receptor plug domain-containing protein, partial [Bacteroidia bacterium]|nr:TonB-dependent receptor plug domain-containing protein [Bacteroidia bacterium]
MFSKKKRISIIIALFCGSVMISYSQKIQIVSAEDLQSIPSAHIRCKDIKQGIEKIFITDTLGIIDVSQFEPSADQIEITAGYLGFKKKTEVINRIGGKKIYLETEKTALNEVVVTAQYAPNSPEKAVHKIKIIDNKKIQSMAAQNLKDVLSNELNIRLSQDNILGSSMNLQGISGQNIKILVDGVPLTGRLNGNIDLSQINMNNVERIEIVEGPLSVNFGT